MASLLHEFNAFKAQKYFDSFMHNCTIWSSLPYPMFIYPSTNIELEKKNVFPPPSLDCPQGRGKLCQKSLSSHYVVPKFYQSCLQVAQNCRKVVSSVCQVLSNFCQGYVKDVSKLCQTFATVDSKLSKVVFKCPKVVKGVTKMSKSCLKDVVKVSQSCLKNV